MGNLINIPFKNKSGFFKKIGAFVQHREPLKYAKYRHEWNSAPKKNDLRDFPVHLGIEPTNACNLNCVFCARHNSDYTFGYMDFELYKKIIDEGSKHSLRSVKLVRGGESLLHPKFSDMIRYAREKGIIDIMFNTNGTLLTDEKSLEIINAKPDLIIFSVDAPDKKIYEEQRVGSNYEQVEKNIKRFIELKNKIYPKIRTRAHMVYTNETESLAPKHIVRWKDIIDEVTVNKAVEYSEAPKNMQFKCRTPFRRLDITWDGKVFVCDPDFDPKQKLLLGNANEQTIYDLWHSPKINHLRDIFRRNSPQEADPCKYCRGC